MTITKCSTPSDLKLKEGNQFGIAGRTGSGKTSVISTLLRLYEYSGSIRIDGVDIKSVPLQHLRKQIAVVPQDPILFQGSISVQPGSDWGHDDVTLLVGIGRGNKRLRIKYSKVFKIVSFRLG